MKLIYEKFKMREKFMNFSFKKFEFIVEFFAANYSFD